MEAWLWAIGGAAAGGGLVWLALARRLARHAREVAAAAKEREKELELAARDAEIARREAQERHAAKLRDEWRDQDERLARREVQLDKRQETIEAKDRGLDERLQRLGEAEDELKVGRIEHERLLSKAREDVLRIAGLSRDEAMRAALDRLDEELRDESAARVRRMQERLDEELEMRTQKALAHSMSRIAIRTVTEATTASVDVKDEDMKGRIIGREGRNIRALEKACGVDLIVDDTPGVVVVSSFDAVRREVARRALEKLVEDGRIHPGRVEEVVEQTRREIDEDIRQTAKKVRAELSVPRVDARLQFCIGRLKYRTSYGQNQLKHAVEVAYLASALAGELKLNPQLALRCGLLHDVGKALDHELLGGHPTIGAELARRVGERPEVVNSIASHHGDVPQESTYAVIAQIADSISASRPGARRDTMEKYVQRLENLEAIARGVKGVEQAFAIQAGRELRVLVDASRVSDAAALLCAREIAKRIESELAYPGEIKVTVIRETRVTEYAR